jgi:predicted Holliday junction resolvase-like endonuclease
MIRIVFFIVLVLLLFIPVYNLIKRIMLYYKVETETEADKDSIDKLKEQKKKILSSLKENEKELEKKKKINNKLKKEIE